MEYPDENKVHIYICDDSNRIEMKKLAEEMNINYITRTERKDAKAGNFNNALAKTDSPLVVTFDADMIPMHDFLMSTVPYFVEDLTNAKKIEKKDEKKQGRTEREKQDLFRHHKVFITLIYFNIICFQKLEYQMNRIISIEIYKYQEIKVIL